MVSILACFPGTVYIVLFLQLFLSSLPFSSPSMEWRRALRGYLLCTLAGRSGVGDMVVYSECADAGSSHQLSPNHSHTPPSHHVLHGQCHPGLTLFQCLTASCFCDISLTTRAPQVLLSESCVADTSPGPSDAPEPEHHMCPLGVPPWGELSRTRCRDWLSAAVLALSSHTVLWPVEEFPAGMCSPVSCTGPSLIVSIFPTDRFTEREGWSHRVPGGVGEVPLLGALLSEMESFESSCAMSQLPNLRLPNPHISSTFLFPLNTHFLSNASKKKKYILHMEKSMHVLSK